MNESIGGRVAGIYSHQLACVSAVWRGALNAIVAVWADDQYRLALREVVKSFEDAL